MFFRNINAWALGIIICSNYISWILTGRILVLYIRQLYGMVKCKKYNYWMYNRSRAFDHFSVVLNDLLNHLEMRTRWSRDLFALRQNLHGELGFQATGRGQAGRPKEWKTRCVLYTYRTLQFCCRGNELFVLSFCIVHLFNIFVLLSSICFFVLMIKSLFPEKLSVLFLS